jgi:L-asparaginase/Glu-tRNA(Gln) amidotransferase subunit D
MKGSVSDAYESGQELSAIGVVPGSDMTPEAGVIQRSIKQASHDSSSVLLQN